MSRRRSRPHRDRPKEQSASQESIGEPVCTRLRLEFDSSESRASFDEVPEANPRGQPRTSRAGAARLICPCPAQGSGLREAPGARPGHVGGTIPANRLETFGHDRGLLIFRMPGAAEQTGPKMKKVSCTSVLNGLIEGGGGVGGADSFTSIRHRSNLLAVLGYVPRHEIERSRPKGSFSCWDEV